MSVARHHAEWLSLVETSGPFLSLPVLMRVFPQGLDGRDSEQAARLRETYEDWLERGAKNSAVHHEWIRHVLRSLLGYSNEFLAEGQAIPPGMEAAMATFGETLRPDLVLKHREADHPPVLLISLYPVDQDLDKPVSGKLWKASAGTRMMELLHATDVPLGLVTNGEEWMLVSARRGDTTGFASWYADLWMQEPLTLRAFHSLLHLRRLMGVAESDTLPGLILESSKDQQEVTDQLGYQVRQAVEVLVQAFDSIDAESGRTLLADVNEKTLYDAALTVMMRLVFLFSAEERGLLLLGDPLYDQNYALSTLSELLRERADQHGEEILERRHDAWCRLIATFRAVHGGVEHEAMRLPAYGGTLFDPDRYPFLEGRPTGRSWRDTTAAPLLINNRVVLHLLEALQLLRVKIPGGGPAEARRVSFRALDIEQIGHVYEGLLDHTAKRAREPILGLAGSKDKEPEIPLTKLEEIAVKGTAALVEFLHEETGRSEKALKRLIEEHDDFDEHALLIACGQDEDLCERVKPFAGLIREDSFGQLVVIATGSVYVTSGSDRRSTGTHYTPRSLTEPIVKHTLESLVYRGPAEGLPQTEWVLKTPKEILALKVCDMAMGSGAFLVEACRYLAERLVEAWEITERKHPGSFLITPDGGLSVGAPTERLIPADIAERIAIARRYVADRCLYGVDINPMAVEMAKLSLWLITLQRDRPFSFLDHALKCGDSLLGVASLSQIEKFSLRPGEQQVTFATSNLFRYVEEASAKRRALEQLPSNLHSQIESKICLLREAEAATSKVKAVADCLMALEIKGTDGHRYEDQRTAAADSLEREMRKTMSDLVRYASAQINGRRTFHWPVEFPEVFDRQGFDAFVGNPPFIGNKYWVERLGDYFQRYAEVLTEGKVGKIDVVALFFRRAFTLLNDSGRGGLIATTTAREGATQQVGFGWIAEVGEIYRAMSQQAWPGQAGVHVCVVWLGKNRSAISRVLDNVTVDAIPATLVGHAAKGNPYQLESAPWAFQGSHNGKGDCFLLNVDDLWFKRLKEAGSPFLRPYITGDDITTGNYRTPPRWCIDCEDLSLDQVQSRNKETFKFLIEVAQPVRTAEALAPYKGLIERWWQMWNHRAPLYRELRQDSLCLALPMVAKHLDVAKLPTSYVFTNKICVLRKGESSQLAVLLSSVFETWVIEYGGTMGAGRLTIVLSTGIQTFPMPQPDQVLGVQGEDYSRSWDSYMLSNDVGFTEIQNNFHDPTLNAADIARLRAKRVDLDNRVIAAYGWKNLDLGHGFHETKQGMRYTISASARRIVLDRLLTLNHQRYEKEVREGLHNKAKNKKTSMKPTSTQGSLLV